MMFLALWLYPFHWFFVLLSLFLYFLPAYLARNKPDFTSILILNILAGWTFIGWIIALIWALQNHKDKPKRSLWPRMHRNPLPAEPFSAALAGSPTGLVRVSAVRAARRFQPRLAKAAALGPRHFAGN